MKTNITINLYEQLYHIDEDAYQLLKQYEEEMKRYFKDKEGEEEILDDIEHRIAELLAELQGNGTVAVNIDHVRSIIQRIGKPEEIGAGIEDTDEEKEQGNSSEEPHTDSCQDDSNNEEEEPPVFHRPNNNSTSSSESCQQQPPYPPLRQRRLFRDVQNSLLGGVISGLCHYFGIAEPTWARIGWVVCFFLFGVGFFAISFIWTIMPYLVLWIIIPPAVTPEERLMMKGKPVTPESLQEESQCGGKKKAPF